ncbi:putative transcription factor interactor and regulator CCHC(Zn) family [Lupinus albus]|uniref:Putative transcription factor interactor and regulator CCHC(Zn) family n=1 Tax=Lupinus albus TaxID=3870 RepID=A0A6A4QB32_LUPAL|nr:putative transcription factor interactor and regulator CCHC(Zn) family [Lupinus albus]
MISLGRGFYEFSFSYIDDIRRVCAMGSWNLSPRVIRVFLWTPDFNPSLHRMENAQCWVKLLGLPQEYWSPKIILSIARGIGTPISLDEATHSRSFGHFARVLVDINLKASLPDQILVERDGYDFLVMMEYEKLPDVCTGCQAIGHLESKCRKTPNKNVEEVTKSSNQDTIIQKNVEEVTAKNVPVKEFFIHLDINQEVAAIDELVGSPPRIINPSVNLGKEVDVIGEVDMVRDAETNTSIMTTNIVHD